MSKRKRKAPKPHIKETNALRACIDALDHLEWAEKARVKQMLAVLYSEFRG